MAIGFLEDKLEGVETRRDRNHFVLSLLPYEKTTTYGKGTKHGPEAIIDASCHIELMDETLRIDAASLGIETVRPGITTLDSITAHVSELKGSHPDALLGFLGGEHSITPAIVAGLGERDFGIVWIDAHTDLRESYLGDSHNHACAGYHSQKLGPIVQIGIRSLAPQEAEFLDRSDRVSAHRGWDDEARRALAELPERVYMTIDLDGLDPSLMRGVGTPEPGGLSWDEMMNILDFVFRTRTVIAYDVVELLPSAEDIVSTYTAARLVYKVMSYHAYYKLGEAK